MSVVQMAGATCQPKPIPDFFLLAALQMSSLRSVSPTYPRSCTLHPMSVPNCRMLIYRLMLPGWSCKPGWPNPSSQWDSHVLNFFIGKQPKPFLQQVYLSAVCSLHNDHGFPDPLVNCLCLQHLLRGIKRVQGPASPSVLFGPVY